MKTVLFACIHNAGRSQMAAAWLDALADRSKARAVSAGTQPGTAVHPEVLVAMREVGIDLAAVSPRLLTDELAREASLLVTMGCGESCPVVPGLRREDWPLEDPKGKTVERVREIRDDVRARVVALLAREGWASPVELRAGRASDRSAVEALLRASDLPDEVDGFPDAYVVAIQDDRLVGCAGLERHGGDGLLRSVAVAPSHRRSGIARRLVDDRIAAARAAGLAALHLLTTTSSAFFERLGFAARGRGEAPPAIAASGQLTGRRCAGAAYLVRPL